MADIVERLFAATPAGYRDDYVRIMRRIRRGKLILSYC